MEETENKTEEQVAEEESSSEEGVQSSPEAAPAAEDPTPKSFPGELQASFEESLNQLPQKKKQGRGALTALVQPLLGALPDQVKRDLEETVGNRYVFSASAATGLNIMLNLILYPVVLMGVAVGLKGLDMVFSQAINVFILLGLFIGFVEGFYRLKEGLIKARPVEEMVLRGAIYGAPLIPLATWFAGGPRLMRDIPVPVKGFYEKGFTDKVERERRYGHAYTIEDLGSAYHLRMEFPRSVPEIALLTNADLPKEMPDYEYDLNLRDGHFVVKGKLTDERVRRYCGNVGAFPGEFTTVIPLDEEVRGFSHRFKNKLLDVLLLKGKIVPEPLSAS